MAITDVLALVQDVGVAGLLLWLLIQERRERMKAQEAILALAKECAEALKDLQE